MKIAVISDIHSNCYALEAVLDEAKHSGVAGYFVLGDIFGYYPWAAETYELLKSIALFKVVKGNHDILTAAPETTAQAAGYAELARHNHQALRARYPEALTWIQGLNVCEAFTWAGRRCLICHGTPVDPVNGRFYPDDDTDPEWLQVPGRIAMLGHTHYPLYRRNPNRAVVLNPGSVGQPRDGLPMPSWGIFDFRRDAFEFKRSLYDLQATVKRLKQMAWDQRAIAMLQKNHPGPLKSE